MEERSEAEHINKVRNRGDLGGVGRWRWKRWTFFFLVLIERWTDGFGEGEFNSGGVSVEDVSRKSGCYGPMMHALEAI